MAVRHFTPALFDFLFDLDVRNERAWFEANRERFERDVREPMLRFIADLQRPLRTVSPHLVTDPRRQGGSMFRIHRDTRFARDKRPYKTWVAAQFRHELARDVHAPGFYLHLEPGNVHAGAGIWRPDPATLRALRDALIARPAAWRRVRDGAWRDAGWELGGETLKTAPRGYPSDHPLIEDLRRKDLVASRPFTEEDVTSPGFLDRYVDSCRQAAPFARFLCRAVGAPF